MNKSDTPRTDAVSTAYKEGPLLDFARALERELNAAQSNGIQWETESEEWERKYCAAQADQTHAWSELRTTKASLAAAQAEARELREALLEIATTQTPAKDAAFYMRVIARAAFAKYAKEDAE